MRLHLLLLASLAPGALVASLTASAAPVRLLETQYYVSVSAYNAAVGSETISRSVTSLSPTSDAVTIAGDDGSIASAEASAELFAVGVETTGFPCICLPQMRSVSAATARSVVAFAPLFDGNATFDFSVAFRSSLGVTYTYGSVRLEDLTTGDLLWDYGWVSDWGPHSWPWGQRQPIPNLSVDQGLYAAHEYVLTMHTNSDANSDHQGASLHLSGLEAVPEPSLAVLIALAGLVLCGTRQSLAAGRRRAAT